MLGNKAKRELKINQRRILIDSIEIGIPSPEQISSWGKRQLPNGETVGEIKNSKTVNYKRFTPLRDGLFCERIFGPVNSFVCACGKRQPRTDIKFCDRCEVEYADQRTRRYRLGLISLVSPVTHLWYLKGRPSYLSLFLGKRKKKVVGLAYCNAYLIEQSFVQGLLLPFGPCENSSYLLDKQTENAFKSPKNDSAPSAPSQNVPKLQFYNIGARDKHGIDWQTQSIKSSVKLKQTENLFYNSVKSNLFSYKNKTDILKKESESKESELFESTKFSTSLRNQTRTGTGTGTGTGVPDLRYAKAGVPDLRYIKARLQSSHDKVDNFRQVSEDLSETSILGHISHSTSPPSFLHLLAEMRNKIEKNILLSYSPKFRKGNTFAQKRFYSSILPPLWGFSYSKLLVRLGFMQYGAEKNDQILLHGFNQDLSLKTSHFELQDEKQAKQEIGLFDNYLQKEFEPFDTEGKSSSSYLRYKKAQVNISQLSNSVSENTNGKVPLSPGFCVKMITSFGDRRFSASWPFQTKETLNWAKPVTDLYRDEVLQKNKAESEYVLISPFASKGLFDSRTHVRSESKNEISEQQSPALSLFAQTPQQEKNLYNRAQSLPFLPSLVCKYNLREDLLNFLHHIPKENDQPIPIYCCVPRWQPLRDVHQFMSEQTLQASNSKPLVKRSDLFLPKRLNKKDVKKEYSQKYKHITSFNKKRFFSFRGKKFNKINGESEIGMMHPFADINNKYFSLLIKSRESNSTVLEHLASCRHALYLALLEKNCRLEKKEIGEKMYTTSVLYVSLSRQDIISESSPFLSRQQIFSKNLESKYNQLFGKVYKRSTVPNMPFINQNIGSLLQPFDTSFHAAPLLICKLRKQDQVTSRARLIKSWRVARLASVVGDTALLCKAVTQARVRSLQYNSPEKLYRFLLLDKVWIRSIALEKYKNSRKLARAKYKYVLRSSTRQFTRNNYYTRLNKSRLKKSYRVQNAKLVPFRNEQKQVLLKAKEKQERQLPITKMGIAYPINAKQRFSANNGINLRTWPRSLAGAGTGVPYLRYAKAQIEGRNLSSDMNGAYKNRRGAIAGGINGFAPNMKKKDQEKKQKKKLYKFGTDVFKNVSKTGVENKETGANKHSKLLVKTWHVPLRSNLRNIYTNLSPIMGRKLMDNISASFFSRSEQRLLNRVSSCVFNVSKYSTHLVPHTSAMQMYDSTTLEKRSYEMGGMPTVSDYDKNINSQPVNWDRNNRGKIFELGQAGEQIPDIRIPNQLGVNSKLSVFLILPQISVSEKNIYDTLEPALEHQNRGSGKGIPKVRSQHGGSESSQNSNNQTSSLYFRRAEKSYYTATTQDQPLLSKSYFADAKQDEQNFSSVVKTQLEKRKPQFDLNSYGLQIQTSDKYSQFFSFANRADLLGLPSSKMRSNISNKSVEGQLSRLFDLKRDSDPVLAGEALKKTSQKNTNQNGSALSPLELMTIREILSYTGGGALQNLLKRFDTQSLTVLLAADVQATRLAYKERMLKNEYPPRRMDKKIITRLGRRIYKNSRRLKIAQLLARSCRRPEWMMISTLPVLPPDLRPILQMSENVVVASDLNNLYQRVIYRNNRFHKLSFIDFHLVTAIQRLVQDAVDRLIENGKGGSKPFYTPGGRALKSLSDVLKGKKGRFRLNLLGKRVDFSGRSVIVVSPALSIHECGLPREIALELYHYFLLRQFLLTRKASSIVIAKKMIKQREPGMWDILRDIIYHHPVLLNRAPTLHRLGIQAFQPRLVKGNAIQLHPLVCSGFNADFDGDQMGIHLPLSVQARAEAWDLLWSRNNLLSPATGQVVLVPSQDMVLGFYYMTQLFSDRELRSFAKHKVVDHSEKVFLSSDQHSAQIQKHKLLTSDLQLDVYKHSYEARQLRLVDRLFFNSTQLVKSFQTGQIRLHTPVWLARNEKIENDEGAQMPLELRLDCFGGSTYIYPRHKVRKDEKTFKSSMYTFTTAGRVIVNQIVFSHNNI